MLHLQGGLTTPNCNEAVLWTNMMSTQTISESQLEVFRTMTDSDGTTLNNNYRPPQPLNARTIYTTGVSKLLTCVLSRAEPKEKKAKKSKKAENSKNGKKTAIWGYQKWHFRCPNQNSKTTF